MRLETQSLGRDEDKPRESKLSTYNQDRERNPVPESKVCVRAPDIKVRV
jgi:hypothetical protein